jgi:superfamily II DNA or RNA helicase
MTTSPALLEFETAPAQGAEVVPVSSGTLLAFTPREYQLDCANLTIAAWLAGFRRILTVLATGAGKTMIFSMLAKYIVDNGGKVLILAHTDELIQQAADKLRMVSGIHAGREKAGDRASLHDTVVVSSVQTLSRPIRLAGWARDHFQLVITDEGHRAHAPSFQRIHAHFDRAFHLFTTATPDRGDQKSLGELVDKCVFDYGLIEGVRDGYLVRPVAKTVPLNVDMRGVKLKKGTDGADLDAAEVARRLDPFLEEIAGRLIEHAGTRKTLVFLPSVDTAIALAGKLKARGVTAEFVAGDTARCPNRHGIIESYRKNEFQFLTNCSIAIEGFDDSGVSCIAPLRATRIRSLLAQMFGRATRPLPGLVDGLATAEERRAAIAASAKPDALLLDFLFLTDRLDLARPAHVIATKPGLAEQMLKQPNGDLLDIEEVAERDLLMCLATEAAKHKKKKGRLFDPLAMAVAVGDETLKSYTPTMAWEKMPVTDDQAKKLIALGGDPAKCPNSGAAALCLQTLTRRKESGLCSPRQMLMLKNFGIDAGYMSAKEAGWRIGSLAKSWARRAARPQPINQHSI